MIELRAMREEDVDGVMAIENVVCEFPWTPNIFVDCIKVGYSCWVLEENGVILGYGLLSANADEAHILNLCIKPERQGEGLGKRMMLNLMEQAKALQAESVYLEVRVSNIVAFELYKKLGFLVVGHRQGYYPAKDGREDAIVLSTSLV